MERNNQIDCYVDKNGDYKDLSETNQPKTMAYKGKFQELYEEECFNSFIEKLPGDVKDVYKRVERLIKGISPIEHAEDSLITGLELFLEDHGLNMELANVSDTPICENTKARIEWEINNSLSYSDQERALEKLESIISKVNEELINSIDVRYASDEVLKKVGEFSSQALRDIISKPEAYKPLSVNVRND